MIFFILVMYSYGSVGVRWRLVELGLARRSGFVGSQEGV